jgi:hypothetical protein
LFRPVREASSAASAPVAAAFAPADPGLDVDLVSLAAVADTPEALLEHVPADVIEELAAFVEEEQDDPGTYFDEEDDDADAAAASSSSSMPLVHAAAPPPAPPPPPPPPVAADEEGFDPEGNDITDPSSMHYMYRHGRMLARVQPVKGGSSTSVRCYLHSGVCSLLIYGSSMPDTSKVKQWLALGELVLDSDSKAVKQGKAERHIQLLKNMRNDIRQAAAAPA